MPDLSLDLRFLRYAIIAAEQGSFRRAAAALDISQSTISRRVQLLESRLGTPIFERHPTGVRPTEAGQHFLRDAAAGAEIVERAVQELSRGPQGDRGAIRVGFLSSISGGFLSELVTAFRAHYPNIELRFVEDTPRAHIAAVLKGHLDAAFIPGNPEANGCITLLLCMERIFLVLPADHPLAGIDVIPWDDIKRERFIVSASGSGPTVEDYLVKQLADVGFRPYIQVHHVGRENLINLVAKGFGLTLTSSPTISTVFPGVVFRPVEGPDDHIPMSALWAAHNRNPALTRLIDLSRRMRRAPAPVPTTVLSRAQGNDPAEL
ncbi:LysR family transcriptional regulator [Mesorhizobium sp. SB112]|uniref:LysR family transcriptional regulator n=1 Tax=Mesorhizobium sp. SB112 TaxID=3151853 RepID=UPI0032648159